MFLSLSSFLRQLLILLNNFHETQHDWLLLNVLLNRLAHTKLYEYSRHILRLKDARLLGLSAPIFVVFFFFEVGLPEGYVSIPSSFWKILNMILLTVVVLDIHFNKS